MYFYATATSTFVAPALLVFYKKIDLNLNDSESVIGSFGSSLQNWYKLLKYNILLNYTSGLQHQDCLHYLLLCYLFYLYTR